MKSFTIKISDIMKCPSAIFLPSHYREDGSCRHDEPICEEEGCDQYKFGKEIYCKTHLIEIYGPEEFNEAEG